MITWIINKLGVMPFILWMKRSFEENGEPSSRRFGAAHCMMLITYIIISKSEINIYMWYSLLVLTGLMWGLITAQNILSFLNKDKTEQVK